MSSLISKRKVFNAFARFNKLTLEQKLSTLESDAIFIDMDEEKNRLVKVYFFDGFFVEKVVSKVTNAVVEIIPFKNGYRVRHFLFSQSIHKKTGKTFLT